MGRLPGVITDVSSSCYGIHHNHVYHHPAGYCYRNGVCHAHIDWYRPCYVEANANGDYGDDNGLAGDGDCKTHCHQR
jgi:hypothetical protein